MPHTAGQDRLGSGTVGFLPRTFQHGDREQKESGEKKLTDIRHPEWSMMSELWAKWRMVYEGGEEFINNFLQEFSRRERSDDFKVRRSITYNPNHAGSIIDIIRNAMTVKLPEVSRKGDEQYEELMRTDVDMQKSSMSTFIGLEVVPLLLAQGKRFVGVDSPELFDLAGVRTLAEDQGRPYVWSIDAEDILSWSYNDMGQFNTLLMREMTDQRDFESGLVKGSMQQFRYMRLLGEGDVDEALGMSGPGVFVAVFDHESKLIGDPQVLQISRIPVVEFRLVDSLIRDIADMQVALLNLSSTDMSFLFRGNFPIYIEQVDQELATLKPLGSKREVTSPSEEISDRERIVTDDKRPNVRVAGAQKGVAYPKEVDAPSFIAPTTDNLKASMEKQSMIAQDMRALIDLSLVSLSVKAVEQSGKSKLADRMGQEAALAYIASVLESGEREVAGLFHEFLGVQNADFEVKYPEGFSIKSEDERHDEVTKLRELRSAVPSETYSKVVDERIAEIMLKPIATPEQIQNAITELEAADYFDDDKRRQEAIHEDVRLKLLSRKTGAKLRGHEEGEADEALAEMSIEADMISGGVVVPPDDDDAGGNDGA